jgi:hypothetical protein
MHTPGAGKTAPLAILKLKAGLIQLTTIDIQ